MLEKQLCDEMSDILGCGAAAFHYSVGVKNLIPQDNHQSFKYLQKACNGDIDKALESQIKIFTILADEIANINDEQYNQAMEQFITETRQHIIAEQLRSCTRLAGYYSQGLGTRVDYKKAADLSRQVCYNQCNTESCNAFKSVSCGVLGASYNEGKGVRMDKAKAKELYGKSCDLGFQNGCDGYKILIEQGY